MKFNLPHYYCNQKFLLTGIPQTQAGLIKRKMSVEDIVFRNSVLNTKSRHRLLDKQNSN
jgi:hypothetical protein